MRPENFRGSVFYPKALKDSGIRENALLHPDTQNKKRKLRYDSELMHR